MADNINLNGPYDTKVPGFNESADIQKALKLFLYGTETPPSTQAEILSNSLAGHLKSIEEDIEDLSSRGIGSDFLSSQPTGVVDGFIWVDSTSAPSSQPQYSQTYYSETPPTNPATGSLWVESTSSPLTLFVWSGSTWRAIGS